MNNNRREMVDGAAAIARGALDAGCDFYAGNFRKLVESVYREKTRFLPLGIALVLLRPELLFLRHLAVLDFLFTRKISV